MNKFIYKKQLLNDVVKSFQLALALCEKQNATRYKARYEDIIYELSLDAALNITQREGSELFIEIYPALLSIVSVDSRNILTALILQQEKHIESSAEIISLLNKNNPRVADIKSSDLMKKNTLDLMALYEKEKIITYSHYVSRNLSALGAKTDDIDIAYHTLSKIRDDREDLKRDICSNLIYLKADISYQNLFDNEFSKYYSEEEYKNILEDIKYKIATKTYLSNKSLADEIIKSADLKHKYLFRAFIAHENNNKREITELLDEVYLLLESDKINNDDYDHIILEIGHVVVKKYPSVSNDILSRLYTLWGNTLDLEADIAMSLFQTDIDKGLRYIQSIEVEYYQYYTIVELVEQYDDKKILIKLLDLVDCFEIDVLKYRAFNALNKKIKIPFEKLLEVSTKILPYNESLSPEV